MPVYQVVGCYMGCDVDESEESEDNIERVLHGPSGRNESMKDAIVKLSIAENAFCVNSSQIRAPTAYRKP